MGQGREGCARGLNLFRVAVAVGALNEIMLLGQQQIFGGSIPAPGDDTWRRRAERRTAGAGGGAGRGWFAGVSGSSPVTFKSIILKWRRGTHEVAHKHNLCDRFPPGPILALFPPLAASLFHSAAFNKGYSRG